MPDCPNCAAPLVTIRQREGLFFHCPECCGRAVTLPQIRRVAGDRFATGLLRQINSNARLSTRTCPFCNGRMRLFQSAAPQLELDACKPCGVVWFDQREFEAVPEGALETPDAARLRGMEALALHRLEQMRERGLTDDGPDETWKTVPALLGFPVESEVNPLTRQPWGTWSLAVVITLLSVWAFTNLDAAVKTFGFVPADAWRWGGLTSISAFFLHAGIFHLASNLYFLLIFGDNVEDYVGCWRYLLLILAATFAGDFVHLLAQSGETTPCIGASGGISGVIVFYALQFPRARLGFLFRYYWHFRWLQVPAWFALLLWLLLQSLTLGMQLSGLSNVGATAHLGGAVAGFLFWLAWRKS